MAMKNIAQTLTIKIWINTTKILVLQSKPQLSMCLYYDMISSFSSNFLLSK